MGWFVIPPHVFAQPDGLHPEGPSVELFNRIAKQMGCDVQWVGPLPLTRLGSEQRAKKGSLGLDGSPLHTKTPTIERYLLYPRTPYFLGRPSVAVRAADPLTEIRSAQDLKGYRIGFVRTPSGTYPSIIADHRGELILDELSGEDWTTRNLSKLLANRLDGVYERNQYTLAYQAAAEGISDKVRILPLPTESIPFYFVFHRNSPAGKDLLRRYEETVSRMKFNYDAMVREAIAAHGKGR